MEMTNTQIRALEIFCEGATCENDYKPTPFLKIAEKLKEEDLKGSASAIQRWSQKFQFKKHLEAQLQLTIIKDEDKTTEERALSSVIEKRLVDINRNNELTADCYELLELFTKQIVENYDKNGVIKRDDIKIVKDIAIFTGGREDKLLDRIAQTGGEKISSEEILKEFETIDIDIEVDEE